MKHLKRFNESSDSQIFKFSKKSDDLVKFIKSNKGKKVQAFYYIYGLRSAAPQSEIFDLSNKKDCNEIIRINSEVHTNIKFVSDDAKTGYSSDYQPSDFR